MLTKEQLKKIEDFAKEQNSEREWIHTRQIRPIAAELAEKEGADKEVVDIAVLFHDVGKDGGFKGHCLRSEKTAREFLEKEGLDKDFVNKVCNAIKRHSGPWNNENLPETIEDKVVFDADMIQQRSPFGVAKQFDDFKDLPFIERVKKSRDTLNRAMEIVITKSGKEMAEKKMKYIDNFFKEVLR